MGIEWDLSSIPHETNYTIRHNITEVQYFYNSTQEKTPALVDMVNSNQFMGGEVFLLVVVAMAVVMIYRLVGVRENTLFGYIVNKFKRNKKVKSSNHITITQKIMLKLGLARIKE